MASVWFSGVDQLNRYAADLGRASLATVVAGSKLVAKTAFDIQRDAQAICPVDTGNLKSSIGVDMLGPLTAEIGPSANYGVFIEYGTSRTAPQAFMGPATDRNAANFQLAVQALGGTMLARA